jgi:hypothetical protein
MHHTLAMTGTTALLEQLSPFVPDDFINELVPPHSGRGRRPHWSSARLYRLLLLTVLTPGPRLAGRGRRLRNLFAQHGADVNRLAVVAAVIFAGLLHAENFTQKHKNAKKFYTLTDLPFPEIQQIVANFPTRSSRVSGLVPSDNLQSRPSRRSRDGTGSNTPADFVRRLCRRRARPWAYQSRRPNVRNS